MVCMNAGYGIAMCVVDMCDWRRGVGHLAGVGRPWRYLELRAR